MWEQLIPIGLNLLSGSGGSDANRQAQQVTQENIDKAINATTFKPFAVTSGYGSSYIDPATGKAGYTLDPRLADYQKQQYGLANQALAGINLDPTQAAQDYYKKIQGLMAGDRQAEDIALRQNQLRSGRIGLGVSPEALGATVPPGMLGSGLTVNPDQFGVNLARNKADAEMAFKAQALAQQDIDNAIARSQKLFGYGTGIEQLGFTPMDYALKIQAQQTPLQKAQADVFTGTSAQKGVEYGQGADLANAGMFKTAANALSNFNFGGGGGSSVPFDSSLWANQTTGGRAATGFLRGGW